MRPGWAVALALLLCACGQSAENAPAAGPAEAVPHPMPPRAEPLRFVGRWAWADDRCAQDAWTFRADGLSTPGEVSCTWDDIREAQGGYDIDATCVAQAPPEAYTFQLRFSEAARAMMVSGGPMGPVSLVSCGAGPP